VRDKKLIIFVGGPRDGQESIDTGLDEILEHKAINPDGPEWEVRPLPPPPGAIERTQRRIARELSQYRITAKLGRLMMPAPGPILQGKFCVVVAYKRRELVCEWGRHDVFVHVDMACVPDEWIPRAVELVRARRSRQLT
jgi:hypothetical protein